MRKIHITRKVYFLLLLTFVIAITNTQVAAVAATTSFEGLIQQKKQYDADKQSLEEKLEKTNQEFEMNSTEIDKILKEIKNANQEIQVLEDRISPLEEAILKALYDIEEIHNNILGIESRTKEREVVVKERMRAMQGQDGPVSYLDVLLGSESFSDFIDRFSALSRLMEADQKILKQQAEDQQLLSKLRADLDKDLAKQRKKREELQKLRFSLEMKIKEKNLLVDRLEEEQDTLQADIRSLQSSYNEINQLSREVESAIQIEQQRIFESEKLKMSALYCHSTGEVDIQKFNSQFISAGQLTNAGQLIIDAAKEYGIDPVLMAAIALHETGNGQSNAIRLFNNPGGLMNPSSNWKELQRFDSLEASLGAMAATLERLIKREGRLSISDLGQAYAPLGAANDPLGLNEHWIPNVTKKVAALGGLTMNCESNAQYSLSLSDGTWITPAAGTVSSHFGWRTHPTTKAKKQHRGLDIASAEGTPIVAAADGIVTKAGEGGGYGNVIMVMHVIDDQVYTIVYGHLSSINIREGQQVTQGQQIGQMGSTGLSTGSHLHFEMHQGYYSVDGPSAMNPLRLININ